MSIGSVNPTAGIGDSYWYEWTIGLIYIVKMLNPDNHIERVILQAPDIQGLDDEVVYYADGQKNVYRLSLQESMTP